MSSDAVTLADLTSTDWSLALDRSTPTQTAGSGIGLVVQGVADINQCISIILSTPPGTDPLRPTFACDLLSWLDKPLAVARSGISSAVITAIALWEPRVLVVPPIVINPGILGQLVIYLTWRLKSSSPIAGANQQLVLTLPNPSAT